MTLKSEYQNRSFDFVYDIQNIDVAASRVLSALSEIQGYIIYLYGDLGAGKTTLVKSIGKLLGVKSTITSPTYAYFNVYQRSDEKKFLHADLYRIRSSLDIEALGIYDFLDASCVACVEWPDYLLLDSSQRIMKVFIDRISNFPEKRRIRIEFP